MKKKSRNVLFNVKLCVVLVSPTSRVTSVKQRIKYHKYLLVSKCLKNETPVYLKIKSTTCLIKILTLSEVGNPKGKN